jgi:nitroreductase
MFTTADAWHIEEAEFPANGTPAAKLRFLLRYAILAPSSHNTQPWRFTIKDDHIELYADRTRSLPCIDPQDRELTISCGAALFHLRLALRHFGYAGVVQLVPDPDNPDLLARVRLGDRSVSTKEEDRLFQSIPRRHTSRMPFHERCVPDAIVETLQVKAIEEGVWMQVVQEGQECNVLGSLIAKADRDQTADPQFRRELAKWIRLDDDTRHDGIPGHALGMPGLISYAAPFFVCTFDTGALTAARDRQLAVGSPLLAVLGTQTDTPQDWLKIGQALAHVLLYATAEGISASFANAPIEVEELRPQVCQAIGATGFAQLILRMGYGQETQPTPRRTVAEVVIDSE